MKSSGDSEAGVSIEPRLMLVVMHFVVCAVRVRLHAKARRHNLASYSSRIDWRGVGIVRELGIT